MPSTPFRRIAVPSTVPERDDPAGPAVRGSALILCIGTLVLLLASSMPPLDRDAPLPWDMSHHYLDALEIRDALTRHSLRDLSSDLIESDLYPPGHSLLLGSWLAAVGSSPISLRLFLWLCLAGFAGALALGISLACHRRDWRALLAGSVLLGACPRLLGLPLIATGGVLAVHAWRQNRHGAAYGLFVAAIAALGAWALFLSVQTGGWDSFLRFAQNRVNSLEWTWTQRLGWYLHVGVDRYFVHPAVGWGALALAGLSLLRLREPLVLGLWAYASITLVALARHPYLLSRNLVGVVAVGIVLAAIGSGVLFTALERAVQSRWRVLAGLPIAAAAVALLLASASSTQEQLARSYRLDAPDLRPVSQFFLEHLPRHATCRVVGTFDEFSPGWVRVLEREVPSSRRPHVGVGFPFPLSNGRAGRDPRPHRAYLETIRNWPDSERPELVLALEVEPSSPLRDAGFERWSAWEVNLVRALRNEPGIRLIDESLFPESGVLAQALTLGHPPLEYVEGWGTEEAWGRWAMQRRARLRLPGSCAGQEIRFEVAAFDGQQGEQHCRVLLEGQELHRFRVDGPAWRWRTERVRIPEYSEKADFTLMLEFSSLHTDEALGLSPRALPFRTVLVSSIPD